METDWENIAKEYKKEIENLHNDMFQAEDVLENKLGTKDWQKAKAILSNSLKSSDKAMLEIKRMK